MQEIRPKNRPITDRQRARFLDALRGGFSVVRAAGSEAQRRRFYRLRSDDPNFAREWDEAYAFWEQVEDLPPRPSTGGLVYFIAPEAAPTPIKIGWTGSTGARRVYECQVGSPVKLRLLGEIPGTREFERTLHQRFAEHRLHREWFAISPADIADLFA